MDSSKYVNTYLDFAVGMIHEALNEKLQLKTQLKLANDLVASRDQVISSLNQEIENSKKKSEEDIKVQTELDEERKKSKNWENLYNAINNKVSHFDNLTNQFNDIKNQYQQKRMEVDLLKKNLEDLRIEKDNQIKVKDTEIQNLRNSQQQSQLDKNTIEIELNGKLNVLNTELNTLKEENEKLAKKISSLEAAKKQINITTRKKSVSSAQPLPPVVDVVEQQKVEILETKNNDF